MVSDIDPRKASIDRALQSEKDAAFALVATARYLLSVNLVTKQVIPLESSRPEYYGISWFPGSLDLVLSHSHLDNAELVDLAAYSQSELGNLSHGKTVSPAFLSMPHQVLCAPDGRVICTNTGRNAITVVDLARPNYFQEARISASRWDRLSLENTTGDHFNSVFLKDGVLYVVAHGHTKGSQLVTFSYPELELVAIEAIKSRTGLHNIWVTNEGQKITCNSATGSVVELTENRTLWNSGCPVYTRGLAASASFILVGESQRSGRDLRRSSMSGLWLIDRQTWQALDYFCLGPFGVVHDVRLANVKDEAHHGHVFRGLEKLMQTNLCTEVTAEKMRRSQTAQRCAVAWNGFDIIYGAPAIDDRGARVTGTGELCLSTQPASTGKTPWTMSFQYSLDGETNDCHVSVVNYRGKGADTDMHALLLQPVSSDQAHLSLWVHDGKAWAIQPGVNVGGLPRRADADVRTDRDGTKLYINKQLVVQLAPELLPLGTGAMGLRWMGSSILPLHNRW